MGIRSAWLKDGINRLESELDYYQGLLDQHGDEEYRQQVETIEGELTEERAKLEELENWLKEF